MTIFWREYSDRESHWCKRDVWGRVSSSNPSAREKDAWVYSHVYKNNFEQQLFPNATCPECKEEVFFFRHKSGGCAWFDDVPWPWPKHGCMDLPKTRCTSEFLKLQERVNKRKNRDPIWTVYSPARFFKLPDPRDNVLEVGGDWGTQTPFDFFKSKCLEYSEKFKPDFVKKLLDKIWVLDENYNRIVQNHYNACRENIFEVQTNRIAVLLNGAKPKTEINIPVSILRSWLIDEQTFILVRSCLAPHAVLWVRSAIGMKSNRNTQGILRWGPEDPDDKILYFYNHENGKMNWREVSTEGLVFTTSHNLESTKVPEITKRP